MLGLAALTALPASSAFAGQEGPAIRGRTSNDTDATFQFDASSPSAKGSDITIRCIDGCKGGAPVYHEHVDVSPTYFMVPKDGSTRFISLWT